MLSQGYNSNGIYSKEYDAGKLVNWFKYNVTETVPPGTSINYEFRFSNDSVIWSDWNNEISSVSRYIQLRINLGTQNPGNTPIVEDINIYYEDNDLFQEYENYTFDKDEIREFYYNENFLVKIVPDYYWYLRIISPSGKTYGQGYGTWQAGNQVHYYTDDDDRIIEVFSGAVENGTWEVYAARDDPGSRDYDANTQYWDPNRIEVAQFSNKLASQTLLFNNDNRVGLVSYYSNIRSTLPLTNNYANLKDSIEDYYADGGTCICCGINRARQMLPVNGTRFIILMSDGDAN